MTKQQRLILVIAIMASFIGALDGFIVNVALPAISRDLGGGLVVQQWVVDAYLIMLGSLILIAGSLSDLFGRERLLKIGLLWFGITSLLCAVAPSGAFLVLARALQGVSGAVLVPSSLAMIIAVFTDKTSQSKAIGIWTAWFSVAAVAGPLLGGLIVSFTSWRWIFAINVVPIAATFWLMNQTGQADHKTQHAKVDFTGAILCAGGLASTVFALIEQSHYGWSSPLIEGTLLVGLSALVAFVWLETRVEQPMLPLALFTRRNFSVGNVATTAIYAGLSMATFLIVITLQQVVGYSALIAGMALLPVTVIMFTLSSRFGELAGHFGPRGFMAAGPIIAAVGFLLMTRMQVDLQYVTQLLPGVLVFGLGLSITVAPLTAAILGDVPPEHAGVASAVNNAVARIAGLIAIAMVGIITGPTITLAGFRRAMLFTALLLFAGGVISAIGIQNTASAKSIEATEV